jgi:GntR family transcriptional regulator
MLVDLPIYHRIARAIESRIYHGIYQPGTAIPSENDFSHEFGVTRLTVRQALKQLAAQGLLVAHRGSGTYVAKRPRVTRPANFIGYLEDMILQPLTMEIKVRAATEVRASAYVRGKLGLPSGSDVVSIERLRSVAGDPVNFVVNYLPLSVGRKIQTEDLTRRSLTHLLMDKGVLPSTATQTLTAEAVGSSVARQLQLAVGAPVLKSEVLISEGSRPVNFAVVHYRSDRTIFTASLVTPARPRVAQRSPLRAQKQTATARPHRARRLGVQSSRE